MDASIRMLTITEQADAAARRAVESGVNEDCPFTRGSDEAREWNRRYEIALLRLTNPATAEGGA